MTATSYRAESLASAKVANAEQENHVRQLVEMGFAPAEAVRAAQIASALNRRQQTILVTWQENAELARAVLAQGCLQSKMLEGRKNRVQIAARAAYVAGLEFLRSNRARSDNLYLFLRFRCVRCGSISAPIKYNHYISGRCPRFECTHQWEDLTNRDQTKRFVDFRVACEHFAIQVGERVAVGQGKVTRNYLRRLKCRCCGFDLADSREASLLCGVKPRHNYSFGGLSILCPAVHGVEKIESARTEHGIEVFPAVASVIERAARLLATNSMDKIPVKYLDCGHLGAVWKLALVKTSLIASLGCPQCSEAYRHSARAAMILVKGNPTQQDLAWATKPAKIVVCRTKALLQDGSEARFIKVGVTNGKRYDRAEILLEYATTQIAAYTIEQNIFASCPELFGAALGADLVDLGDAGHSETASLESYAAIEVAYGAAIRRWEEGDRAPPDDTYRLRATPLSLRSLTRG